MPKPSIASPGFEFDARTLVLADLATVVTWPDTSGEGKDATGVNTPQYEKTGWDILTPDVRLIRADSDHFTFDGAAFIGTNFTIFCVVEATDLDTISTILMGGSASTNLGMIQIAIAVNGSVFFGLFDTGPGTNDITSATGLVSEGDKAILTCRHSSVDGKLLRLDGVQIGTNTGLDHLATWVDPFVGRVLADSGEGRLAWVAGYKSAASVAEMVEMEDWLTEQFIHVAASSPLQPHWSYNDGSLQTYSMSLPQRPWNFGSRGLGGSDVSASGVPAAFEIRRDNLLHLRLRFPASEWGEIERLVRHLQRGGSATFFPDQNVGSVSHLVYGDKPGMGEEIRPQRSDEPSTLEIDITIRRTTDAIFDDLYY